MLEPTIVIWLVLSPSLPWVASDCLSLPPSFRSFQGPLRLPCGSFAKTCLPSVSWDVTVPWSKLPVLLHFFTDVGARELGRSNDVSDRLLRVSESCWLSQVWLELHRTIPVSSSDGSTEPCLALVPQLLLLRWCPLVVWRFWAAGGPGLRVSVERLVPSSRGVSRRGKVSSGF